MLSHTIFQNTAVKSKDKFSSYILFLLSKLQLGPFFYLGLYICQ